MYSPQFVELLRLNLSDGSSFHGASSVKVDSRGNVWVADRDNQRVLEFSADGSRLLSQFAVAVRACGMDIDGSDRLYVAMGNSTGQYSLNGSLLTSFTGNSSFSAAYDVKVNRCGSVYVLEFGESYQKRSLQRLSGSHSKTR